MRRQKLSGLTGVVTAITTILGLTGVAFASGGKMFEPGSLSTASGNLLGGVFSHSQIQECALCHAEPWGTDTMADRCLACHSDIVQQLQDSSSLHSLIRFSEPDMNCRACHTEHHGPMASLTQMPPGWNPHDQLHFSLKTHRLQANGEPFECKHCHGNKFTQPFDQSVCANCHLQIDLPFAQTHILTFWTDCMACHDGLDSHGSRFNHNLVAFQLTGQHASAACSGCHINAHNLDDLKNAPHECYQCHQKDDFHKGQLGTNCSSCHTSEGWKPAHVDHSQFTFHLDGKHAAVACENCHQNSIFKGTPMDCASCHLKDDKHNGQFGTSCGNCHNPKAWSLASVDHSKFAFHLDGKHATVTCENCHKNGIFKDTPTNCAACHGGTDPHIGNLGTQCQNCHTVNGWTPSTFDHNLSSFKLTGQHVTADCSSCHTSLVFKETPSKCYACHSSQDPHGGRFGTDCSACHTTNAWKPATFDHNLSSFKLSGAHVSASCDKCHINGVFQGISSNCYSCHANNDRHAGKYGLNCSTCHSTSAWQPATFDHGRSNFPLTGAHAKANCSSCHKSGTYSGLSTACSSCHNDPTFHAGAFGTNCSSCHSTSTWQPATFNRSHPSVADEGGRGVNHGGASCRTCHPSTVRSATCTTCHGSNNPDGDGDGDGDGDDD